jgi:hypothetical protein
MAPYLEDRAKQLAKELVGDGLHLGLIHAAMSDAKRQAQAGLVKTPVDDSQYGPCDQSYTREWRQP